MVNKTFQNKSKKKKSKTTATERSRKWQKERKSIYIFPDTKKRLDDFGKKKDTYDTIIKNLIDFAEKNRDLYNKLLFSIK